MNADLTIVEYLNKQFVKHLINIVEDPPCGNDDEERVVNGFVTLILSYNQHFEGEIFFIVCFIPGIFSALKDSLFSLHRCKEQYCYASFIRKGNI